MVLGLHTHRRRSPAGWIGAGDAQLVKWRSHASERSEREQRLGHYTVMTSERFWPTLQTDKPRKCLILLVGDVGFRTYDPLIKEFTRLLSDCNVVWQSILAFLRPDPPLEGIPFSTECQTQITPPA